MASFFTLKGIKSMTIVIKPTFMNHMNGYPVVVQGQRVKFENGELILDDKSDKDKIEFLRNHQSFNINFFEDIEPVAKPHKARATAGA